MNQQRQPKGVRTGGQFATDARSDDIDDLAADTGPDPRLPAYFDDEVRRFGHDHQLAEQVTGRIAGTPVDGRVLAAWRGEEGDHNAVIDPNLGSGEVYVFQVSDRSYSIQADVPDDHGEDFPDSVDAWTFTAKVGKHDLDTNWGQALEDDALSQTMHAVRGQVAAYHAGFTECEIADEWSTLRTDMVGEGPVYLAVSHQHPAGIFTLDPDSDREPEPLSYLDYQQMVDDYGQPMIDKTCVNAARFQNELDRLDQAAGTPSGDQED